MFNYDVPTCCVRVNKSMLGILKAILYFTVANIVFFVICFIVSMRLHEMMTYDFEDPESRRMYIFNPWYLLWDFSGYIVILMILIVVLLWFFIYYDLYYLFDFLCYLFLCEFSIFLITFIWINLVGYIFSLSKSYAKLIEYILYFELKEKEYDKGIAKREYNIQKRWPSIADELNSLYILDVIFTQLLEETYEKRHDLSEYTVKNFALSTLRMNNKKALNYFRSILCETKSACYISLFCVLIMFIVLHYLLFKYYLSYDIIIYADRKNNTWNLKTMKLNLLKAKNGVYVLFIGSDDMYFVDKMPNKGYFLLIKVRNKKIIDFVSYFDKDIQDSINIGDNLLWF